MWKWMRPLIIVLAVILAVVITLGNPVVRSQTAAKPTTRITYPLQDAWQVQSSDRVGDNGAQFSQPHYENIDWLPTSVPTSVMGALVANQTFASDPLYGMNLQNISDAPFVNARWWFRRVFDLPDLSGDRRVWLKLEGLNYRAQVWFNGTQLVDPMPQNAQYASQIQFTGTFRTYMLDVTSLVHARALNALAIGITRAQSPYQDYTIHFVDWNPDPPDLDMGILNGATLLITGPVRLDHPYIVTNSLANDTANVTVYADVVNGQQQPISGTLSGTVAGASFTQHISLGAGTTQTVTTTFAIAHPDLWWPWQYGNPDLVQLDLTFTPDGGTNISDESLTNVGIRTISSHLITPPGRDPQRIFTVNGKDILIRGAAYTPDIFLSHDPLREEAEMQYVRQMNLNALRFEGQFMDDHFYELADKYGILTISGWSCCDAFQEEGNQTIQGASLEIVKESLRSLLLRLRMHPSTLAWLNGSDKAPFPATLAAYQQIEDQMHWRPALPALSSATDLHGNNQPTREDASAPSGMKMRGPYQWVPPSYWENDALDGAAWGFATEVSPGPSIPTSDGLNAFLPANTLPDDTWNYHTPLYTYHNLDQIQSVLRQEYGQWGNRDAFAEMAQAEAYEAERAMFEAWGRHKYANATGVIQWMLNNAWPGMYWHLYDYYLHPGGGFFGTRNALEPLHIQYTYLDRMVSIVNSTLNAYPKLTAHATIFNLDGTRAWDSGDQATSVAVDGVQNILQVPSQGNFSRTYFLRLTLQSNGTTVSNQTYWLSTTSTTGDAPDYTALAHMAHVHLKTNDQHASDGNITRETVTLTNPSSGVAFFVRVAIDKGNNGPEVAPILWNDNYITLLPGESRTLTATYNSVDLTGTQPHLSVQSFSDVAG